MLSAEQYLALSAIAYSDLPSTRNPITGDHWKIEELIKEKKIEGYSKSGQVSLEFSHLSELGNWQLVSTFTCDTPIIGSGYSGSAFLNPDTNELVFAFRGTELEMKWTIGDFVTDAAIASLQPPQTQSQFFEALVFVRDTIDKLSDRFGCFETARAIDRYIQESNGKISFTGHSLGGGLAQYLTYQTKGKATTFNAVGIGQGLCVLDPTLPFNSGQYDDLLTDYVNESDLVGNVGWQIGRTVSLQDNTAADYSQVDFQSISRMLKLDILQLDSKNGCNVDMSASFNHILKDVAKRGYDVESTRRMYYMQGGTINKDYIWSNIFDFHGLSTMINPGTHKLTQSTKLWDTITYSQGYKDLNKVINAMRVVKVSNDEGHYRNGTRSLLTPELTYTAPDGGIYFKLANNFKYTYTDQALDAANAIIEDYKKEAMSSNVESYCNIYNFSITEANRRVDPLILDLDDDGAETTNVVSSSTYFDLDANGFGEKTAWVGKDDGLLVLDRNKDGRINNGGELFGDQVRLKNGTFAQSGFQALGELDANADGVIDSKDAIYSDLRIWQDINQDGISQATELKTLSDRSISTISLSSTELNKTDVSGNIEARTGKYQKADGTWSGLSEFLLQRDPAKSVDEVSILISDDVAQLPDVQGTGNVTSLQKSIMLDTSGQLKQLVQQFCAATNEANREALMHKILYKWVGADGVDPKSRGDLFDAQKLVVLEKFFGRDYTSTNNNLVVSAGLSNLQKSYTGLYEYMYSEMMAQSHFKAMGTSDTETANYEKIAKYIDAKITDEYAAGVMTLQQFIRMIKGYGANAATSLVAFRDAFCDLSPARMTLIDSLELRPNQDIYDATAGQVIFATVDNNLMDGSRRNDILLGMNGNDTIRGDYGNDILDGGAGNDMLYGGYGNDTYIFGKGYGVDTIEDHNASELNRIVMRPTVTPDEVELRRTISGDLEIVIKGTTDKLIVKNHFNFFMMTLQEIKFANNVTWDSEKIISLTRVLSGTNGSDVLEGSAYIEDIIDGGAGNDTLKSNGSNDILRGGEGNDTYIVYSNVTIEENDSNPGNIDTLDVYAEKAAYLSYKRSYNGDLTITNNETRSIITIKNYYTRDAAKIEKISYKSKDVVNFVADLLEIYGSDGNDVIYGDVGRNNFLFGGKGNDTLDARKGSGTLYGQDGDDLLYGGAKEDTLYGDNGNDKLYGSAGNDVLSSGEGNDILAGGVGSDILEGGDGNDTYIFEKGDGSDTIIDKSGVDSVRFGSGILPSDITVSRTSDPSSSSGENLILTMQGTDKLVIDNFFTTTYGTKPVNTHKIDTFVFADGTTWSVDTILEKARTIRGTDSAETIIGYNDQANIIYGYGGNDTLKLSYQNTNNTYLNGGDGNDILGSSSGNDVLIGGLGNDELYGGYGSDIYTFSKGDGSDTIYDSFSQGSDTIQFTANISPTDVDVSRGREFEDKDLILTIAGTNDRIKVCEFFDSTENAQKSVKIAFADGTIWDRNTILAKAEVIKGTETSETIYGYSDQPNIIYGYGGNDIIDGNIYNDRLYGGAGNDTLSAREGHDRLYGENGDDTLNAGDGNDYVYGGIGNDGMNGDAGNDRLYGEAGNDILKAGDGNDGLDGGAGNDLLYGEAGNDTYIFRKGFGDDTLIDTAGTDVIRFEDGILPAHITASRSGYGGDNLVLTRSGTTDKLTIIDFFATKLDGTYDKTHQIESFIFSDGTTWSTSTVTEKANIIYGTENDDSLMNYWDQPSTIYGYGGDDYLYSDSKTNSTFDGGSGHDSLTCLYGNNTLTGGTGNDTIEGGSGNDTYVFKKGDGKDTIIDSYGKDTIKFGSGISPSDVNITRANASGFGTGKDLVLSIAGTNDKITLYGFFALSGDVTRGYTYRIENIVFADKTVWNIDTLLAKARVINGTETIDTIYGYSDQSNYIYGRGGNDILYGNSKSDRLYGGIGADRLEGKDGDDRLYGETGNDTLRGGNGNDALNGGQGNDILEGGAGNDTYVFNKGDGADTISDLSSTIPSNIALFSDAKTIDLIFSRSSSNMLVSRYKTTDNVSIKSWFSNSSMKIGTMKSANGSTISSTKVEQLIQAMASFSSKNNGMSWSQAITSKPQEVQAIVDKYWTPPTS